MNGVTVRGLGLRLPGASTMDDLARQLAAPDTALAPIERPVHAPVDPAIPPTRGLRGVPHESLLALAAATEMPTPPESAAVVWASSTAGLPEYAGVCVEASTLEPGLVNPSLGPASAFNGPAATLAIRLGLTGPNLTVTGGATAGISAVAEAVRLIEGGDAGVAVVGGSAAVSRWSMAAAPDGSQPGSPLVPAEGAVCIAIGPPGERAGNVRIADCRRADLVRAAAQIIHAAARPETRPGGLVVSALDTRLVDALAAGQPFRVWHVERLLGDFGAAGGFLAVACAVALCTAAREPTTILALAVEPCGTTALLEVSTS